MYFFNYGDKSKFGIDKFLRTVAWQMACQNETIFAHLVKQFQKDAHLRVADYRTVWRKLFLDGILKLKLSTRDYLLIIDALTEADSPCTAKTPVCTLHLTLRTAHFV